MARPAPSEHDEETVTLPAAVRFPVELIPPEGFDPADLATWPRVEGRLEWVGGRLLYMPPCGGSQQITVADVVITLGPWVRARPEFVLGTNEAGMRLGEDTRGADVAVWHRAEVVVSEPGLRHVSPILAVEVAGRDEPEAALRAKARWYLDVGVPVVWLVLPKDRRVVVITREGECTLGPGETIPPHPALPGLAPPVDDLFRQSGA